MKSALGVLPAAACWVAAVAAAMMTTTLIAFVAQKAALYWQGYR